MRIGMIVMNEFRPDVRVMKEAQALRSEGHEVLIFALKHRRSEREVVGGVKVHRVAVGGGRGKANFLSQARRYRRFVTRAARACLAWSPDVCHVHDATALFPGYLVARQAKCPLIYDAHEYEAGRQFVGGRIPRLMRLAWTVPERLFIRQAAEVITVSESISRALTHDYGISPPVVVRNVPPWQGFTSSDLLRTELGLPKEVPVLLYQGGLVRGRGLENTIQSLVYVKNAVLVIIGAGALAGELRRLAIEHGVSSRVHMTGHIQSDRLPLYTPSADIGLHLLQNTCLNHDYALPNKLFEYIHAGLPMVVGNTLEMKRLVESNNIGVSVDPNSPRSVAEGVHTIWSDQDMYNLMHENAVSAARERYNWQEESTKLIALYDQVFSRMNPLTRL